MKKEDPCNMGTCFLADVFHINVENLVRIPFSCSSKLRSNCNKEKNPSPNAFFSDSVY